MDEMIYPDMSSNEQRLDYLDNPERGFTPVKDFNYKVAYLKKGKQHEQEAIAGLSHDPSQENEVP